MRSATNGADAMQIPGTLFTSYNLWYENAMKMFSINYKKGEIIPAGTLMADAVLHTGHKPRLDLTWGETGARFSIHFQSRYHPGVTAEQFAGRLLVLQSLEELTEGMSDHEKSCIERAVVEPGMSGKAVLVSFGYPPEHFTPSVQSNKWFYWLNRFVKKELHFDENGMTVNGM
jgi:hypothetical protein